MTGPSGASFRAAGSRRHQQRAEQQVGPIALALLARVMLLDGEYAAVADLYRRVLAERPDDAMTRAEALCLRWAKPTAAKPI